jgi:hypothetical protein
MKKIFSLIVIIIACITLMDAMTLTTTAFAEGQERAPGQIDPRRNPSMDAPLNWCKPGCQSGLLPPGQTAGANPGQCQKAGIEEDCFS